MQAGRSRRMKGSRKVSFLFGRRGKRKAQWLSPATRQTHSQNPCIWCRTMVFVFVYILRSIYIWWWEPWENKAASPGCVLETSHSTVFHENRFHGEQHRATCNPLSFPGNRQNISTAAPLSPAEKKQTWFCLPHSFPTFFKLS